MACLILLLWQPRTLFFLYGHGADVTMPFLVNRGAVYCCTIFFLLAFLDSFIVDISSYGRQNNLHLPTMMFVLCLQLSFVQA